MRLPRQDVKKVSLDIQSQKSRQRTAFSAAGARRSQALRSVRLALSAEQESVSENEDFYAAAELRHENEQCNGEEVVQRRDVADLKANDRRIRKNLRSAARWQQTKFNFARLLSIHEKLELASASGEQTSSSRSPVAQQDASEFLNEIWRGKRDWRVRPRPEGRRVVVFLQGNVLHCVDKFGVERHRIGRTEYNSHIFRPWCKDVVLDAILQEFHPRLLFVLDVLVWNRAEIFKNEWMYRAFFLSSKFDELMDENNLVADLQLCYVPAVELDRLSQLQQWIFKSNNFSRAKFEKTEQKKLNKTNENSSAQSCVAAPEYSDVPGFDDEEDATTRLLYRILDYEREHAASMFDGLLIENIEAEYFVGETAFSIHWRDEATSRYISDRGTSLLQADSAAEDPSESSGALDAYSMTETGSVPTASVAKTLGKLSRPSQRIRLRLDCHGFLTTRDGCFCFLGPTRDVLSTEVLESTSTASGALSSSDRVDPRRARQCSRLQAVGAALRRKGAQLLADMEYLDFVIVDLRFGGCKSIADTDSRLVAAKEAYGLKMECEYDEDDSDEESSSNIHVDDEAMQSTQDGYELSGASLLRWTPSIRGATGWRHSLWEDYSSLLSGTP